MIIQVDKEGKKVIEELCDVALKNGGMNNLNGVNLVLTSIELIKESKDSENKE